MIAVTGASGYLGSRLVRRLGGRARPLVRAERSYLGEAQHVVDLTGPVGAIAEALDGIETVVHFAGRNEVIAADDPDTAMTDTVVGSRHLAAAVEQAHVRRVVYASTVHVYGARLQPGAVVDEDTAPAPRSSYAIARLASEHVLGCLEPRGVDVVVLRLTNAVGAPADVGVDRWTLVTNDLCRQAVTTGTLTLRSSGQQHRDFVAVSDIEDIVVAAADGAVPSGTYNVGSGSPVTIRELAHLVQERFEALSGQRPALDAPPPTGPPDEPYRVDLARLHATGFRPTTPLVDAVDETVAFCLGEKDELSATSNEP